MARRKIQQRRRQKKQGSSFWKWLSLALGGILLYLGLKYALFSDHKTKKPQPKERTQKSKVEPHPKPSPPPEDKEEKQEPEVKAEVEKGPIQDWTFEKAANFLPEDAYQDNYIVLPTEQKASALLAFAKKIPGKIPGNQGMTNTLPGAEYLFWNGKEYTKQEISFDVLKPALGNIANKGFIGIPQIKKPILEEGKTQLFPAQLFLTNDPREVIAYLVVDENGSRWAQLHHASGKKIPAAILKGTTQNTTREVQFKKYQSKQYLIVENGILEDWKAYAGYQWNVQAYAWDGKDFIFDDDHSKELTKIKKLSKPSENP